MCVAYVWEFCWRAHYFHTMKTKAIVNGLGSMYYAMPVCLFRTASFDGQGNIQIHQVQFRIHIYMKIFKFLQILVRNLEFWVIVWSRLLLWTEFRSIEQNFRRIPITSASLTKLKNTRHWLEICSTFFGFRQIFRSEFCQKSRRQQNSWKILGGYLAFL